MPSPRSSLCSGVVAGLIYVIGGANGGVNGNASSTVEDHASATDTWSAAIAMPRARSGRGRHLRPG